MCCCFIRKRPFCFVLFQLLFLWACNCVYDLRLCLWRTFLHHKRDKVSFKIHRIGCWISKSCLVCFMFVSFFVVVVPALVFVLRSYYKSLLLYHKRITNGNECRSQKSFLLVRFLVSIVNLKTCTNNKHQHLILCQTKI